MRSFFSQLSGIFVLAAINLSIHKFEDNISTRNVSIAEALTYAQPLKDLKAHFIRQHNTLSHEIFSAQEQSLDDLTRLTDHLIYLHTTYGTVNTKRFQRLRLAYQSITALKDNKLKPTPYGLSPWKIHMKNLDAAATTRDNQLNLIHSMLQDR